MSNKKRVLGKGLSALLKNPETDITNSDGEVKLAGSVSEISISQIKVNPFQPRTEFDQEALNELSISIKELGIIQPITVRKLGYDNYQIISGERRFRATQLAGLEKIPAYIRIANDKEMLEMALVENIQREELNPVEIALSYKRLMEECKLTQDKMSERVGKKRSTISNYIRLLKLPAEILAGLRDQTISMGHARALINMNDQESQINLFRDVVSKGFSVREIEQIVKEFGDITYKQTSRPRSKSNNILTFEQQKFTNDLSHKLNKKIQLKVLKSGKGKILINFNSEDELRDIFNQLNLF